MTTACQHASHPSQERWGHPGWKPPSRAGIAQAPAPPVLRDPERPRPRKQNRESPMHASQDDERRGSLLPCREAVVVPTEQHNPCVKLEEHMHATGGSVMTGPRREFNSVCRAGIKRARSRHWRTTKTNVWSLRWSR